jgi:putative ABC transport system permease protein
MNDIRLALRSLARAPGFAAAAVATLALGIGASAAVFTLVHAVILKPLPFRDPARLLAVWDTYLPQFARIGVSPAEFDAWSPEDTLFEQTAWYRSVPLNLTLAAPGGDAQEISATIIAPALLPMLAAKPTLGHAPDSPSSVLLSDRLWRTRFASDPQIVGRQLRLNGQAFTISGVMPGTFRFPEFAEVWLGDGPLIGDLRTNPVRHGLGFVGRLRASVTVQQATARLDAIARQLAAEHPRTSKGWGMRVATLADDLTSSRRPVLWMLSGAVALLLLIACATVAGLLLARAGARRKEFAVRIALGAGARHLVRQMLAESLVLATLGGALGLALARLALRVFSSESVALEPAVMIFLLASIGVTALVFGLAPVASILRRDLSIAMKDSRVTGALIVAEFAMAMVLVAGAGLLAKSVARVMHVNPGFDAGGVLTLRISVPPARDPVPLMRGIEEQVRQVPGVTAMAASNALPVIADRANSSRFHVPESPSSDLNTPPAAQIRLVTPEYLPAMKIPLVSGREFTERDYTTDAVIINRTLARRFWPGQDPVGRRFITGLFGATPTYSTIVGVAGDVKDFGLDSEDSFDLYFPAVAPRYLVVRFQGDPAAGASALRAAIRRADPELPVSEVRTMAAIIEGSASTRQQTATLLGAFAALALLLAMVGIYGVTSRLVAQRTREIGVRMALGTRPGQVMWGVLARGLRLGAIGSAIGLAASLALGSVAARFVFEVSPADPAVLAFAAGLLLITAAAACYFPARRSASVDPSTALRWE